jgi:hypothetical protein
MKRLFLASFNSITATSAMNSKWCKKRQCAVEIQMSAEAAAELNFGSSPFVLKEGEDKATRQKSVIQRSHIPTEDIGGVDADDLKSVGDASNAETVFGNEEDDDDEYAEYEDDDVSMMSDNEGFEEAQGMDDESTVHNGDSEEETDEEMCEEKEEEDADSAFSTKADLDDLAAQGRKVRGESREDLESQRVHARARARAEIAAKSKEIEDWMERLKVKEAALNEALRMAEEKEKSSSTPGATGGEAEGFQDSQEASASGASAGIK